MKTYLPYTPTSFNTEYLRVTDICVNTHTHTHTHYTLTSLKKEGFRIYLKHRTHDMVSFAL